MKKKAIKLTQFMDKQIKTTLKGGLEDFVKIIWLICQLIKYYISPHLVTVVIPHY